MYSGLERHSLVWLTAAGWQAAIASVQPEHAGALTQWRQNDWPAIVRRSDAGADAAAGDIFLGVPLPPDAAGVKVRIGLRVAPSQVERTSAALALRSALPAAGRWRDRLTALSDAAPGLRVFGSLAMQALTGLQYLSPGSDVDLLFHPVSRRQLEDVIPLLGRHAEHLPLDGEVVFPGGAAVSWKEWQAAIAHPAKVLVKELHAVRLADTASLLATLETT
nr:malonate decarboxylase holo-[acyl-carrier-protein] synthase [uncultured Duganella sp.]